MILFDSFHLFVHFPDRTIASPHSKGLPVTAPLRIVLPGLGAVSTTLMAGVTTIRDMGGKDGIDLGLKQAIRNWHQSRVNKHYIKKH